MISGCASRLCFKYDSEKESMHNARPLDVIAFTNLCLHDHGLAVSPKGMRLLENTSAHTCSVQLGDRKWRSCNFLLVTEVCRESRCKQR